MSQEYISSDHAEQDRAVRAHQERILGRSGQDALASVSPDQKSAKIGPEWANLMEGTDHDLTEILKQILSLRGGPAQTRTGDLYRVKVAL